MPTNRKTGKRGSKAAADKAQLDLMEHSPLPDTYTPSPDDPTAEVPTSREDIGAKVCLKRDIIQVASDLLAGVGDPRKLAVQLRTWQTIVESLFGKPGANGSDEPPPPADWDGMPAPDRESS